MAARRRRPEGSLATPSLVAWFLFAVGLVALGRAVFQSVRAPESPPPPAIVKPPGRAPEHHPGGAEAARRHRRPVDLLTGRDPRRWPPPRPRNGRARVAIIIDDIGQDRAAVERAARIRQPLTFAVLPHLGYSRAAADYLHGRGYEIMLHLPMEPLGYPRQDPGPGAILSTMSAAAIRRTVDQAIRAVPHVLGVNNHMGSRLSSDRQRMRIVLGALHERALFFIDSRTIDTSVAYTIARELRVPAAERAVFLDARPGRSNVRSELQRTVLLARERGSAIAIGHPYPTTLEVLAAELPRLSGSIDLVTASVLVR